MPGGGGGAGGAGGGHYETLVPGLRDLIDAQGASLEAAIATAAHTVMSHLYQDSDETILDMIDQALERTLASISSRPQREKGQKVGELVRESCISSRQGDGMHPDNPYLMTFKYQPTGEPGNHMVDPVNTGQGYFNPKAGDLTPFGPLDPMDKFRAPLPPGFDQNLELDQTNPEYLQNLRQVKELGKRRGGMAGDPIPNDDPS